MAAREGVNRYKVVQRIEFAHEKSNLNGVVWSNDNRLAIGTNTTVFVINLKGVENVDDTKSRKLKYSRSNIVTKGELKQYDVGVEFLETPMPLFTTEPGYSTAMLDPALFPTILRQTCIFDVVVMKWSPVECDQIGRSVLAILFRTNSLCFYTTAKNNKWVKIVDLTELHYQQLKKDNYFESHYTMRGQRPQDPRKTIGSAKTWEKFDEWQLRKYLMNFTSIEWCPSMTVCEDDVKKKKSKFMFFATVVKNGNLFIWQGMVPLGHSDCGVQRVLAAQSSLFDPSALAWSRVDDNGISYLACGNTAGLIKVFFIKIISAALPRLTFVKAYTFNTAADDLKVECLTWHSKGNRLFLACSKGPHVSLFSSYIMDGGALSKPVQQVITGLHLLNITGLTISPTGMLYTTSSEGTLQQYQIGGSEPSILVDYSAASGFGFIGVTVSPNGAFLAVLEHRKQMYHPKSGFQTVLYCQVSVLSLMTEEENQQQLTKWTSQAIESPQLWDCLFFKELFSESLAESLTLPESLDKFSQSYLQYLRSLFNMRMKRESPGMKDSVQEMNDGESLKDANSGTTEEQPSQMVEIINKIEEHIAVLTMQKILNAYLGCLGKSLNADTVLTNEPLILSICRWLAEKSPSHATTELLAKCWRKFSLHHSYSRPEQQMDVDNENNSDSYSQTKNSQHPSDVRKTLKNLDVFEKCICGQSVPLQEFRYARCSAGHAWPRCCVTFKLLDGKKCRVCQNCGAYALIQTVAPKALTDWSKDLVKNCLKCSYCGGWFEFS